MAKNIATFNEYFTCIQTILSFFKKLFFISFSWTLNMRLHTCNIPIAMEENKVISKQREREMIVALYKAYNI